MKKPNIRGEALRNAILTAASQLFIERGFGGTNIRDIAKALGVTRTALYYYFKNKEAILERVAEDIIFTANRQTANVSAKSELDPLNALVFIVERHARLILSRPVEFRVFDRSEVDLPVKQRRLAETARRGVLANFTEVIERGIQSGDFRAVDARVAALAIIGMCNWTAWWFKPGGRKQAEDIVKILSDLAVQALKRGDGQQRGRTDLRSRVRILREDIDYLERMLAEQPAEKAASGRARGARKPR